MDDINSGDYYGKTKSTAGGKFINSNGNYGIKSNDIQLEEMRVLGPGNKNGNKNENININKTRLIDVHVNNIEQHKVVDTPISTNELNNKIEGENVGLNDDQNEDNNNDDDDDDVDVEYIYGAKPTKNDTEGAK